jgi:3-deoxy-D-manno-octulosonic-acid transferase
MTTRLTLPLKVYRFAAAALEPMALTLLQVRKRRGKEEATRLAERRGSGGPARPSGRLAWLHGASVGETISILPVVERLVRRGFTVLVTSGTVTSANMLAKRLPPGAFHQFVPLDVPRYMRRFLDHWQPDLALMTESELWPNMILELGERRIPLILVNGRMSERSFRRWRRAPNSARTLLDHFDICLTQTVGDGERVARLGAPRVSVAGNLKFDAPAPPADAAALASFSGLLSGRPVWVAASTHESEEEIVCAVHRALIARYPRLMTIVAPRHPQRGAEVADIATADRLRAARRSLDQVPNWTTDIYIVDTIGELGLFFRLAPIVFMGASLIPRGGHNPIEPAKLGSAILHGPHVHNFADVYAALDRADGAMPVSDAETLALAVSALMKDPARVRSMARAAAHMVETHGGALDRTLQAIEPYVLQMDLEAR